MNIGDITFWGILLRLLVATALGAAVGYEREARDKPAGLRTCALVALGSAAYALLGLYVLEELADDPNASADIMRLVSGVITGVGFLGAGAIIQGRTHVKGMTTAASIWLVAAVGLACGLGAYAIAVPLVLLAYVVLAALRRFERHVNDSADPPSD